MLLQRRFRPVIGLDITTSSIKLIELTKTGDSYRVESYSAEPTPPNAINEKAIVDAQAVGEAVRRAVKRAGARSKECAVAVSGDAAITKVIQMPRNLRDNELESQVEMQADQYIPFPMEEVSFDFEVIGPSEKDPDMLDVLLVATRSENVEQRQAAVQAAGLTARIVDVEAFALENACRLLTHQMPDGGMERSIAVIDFGASSTTFSERVATSSTSSMSGSFSDGPITSKSKLTSSIGNGMYWSACISTCDSSSLSRRLRGIWITLVMAASPLTATAHSLLRAPARFTARRTASPTAWASTIAFSLIAFGGVGSAA